MEEKFDYRLIKGDSLPKTKVCYISPSAIHTNRWMEAFSERGYKVYLITNSRCWIAPEPRFIPVFLLQSPSRTKRHVIPNTLEAVRILKEIDPDLVHLHVQHLYSLASILSGFPFVLTSWGLEVLTLPHADFFRKSLARIAATKAYAITVDAKCMQEIWVSMGIPRNKIWVIPFGVDMSKFNPNVDGSAIRRKLHIQKTDVVVISTRPFYNNNHYNIECLIRAIPMIVRGHENAKFIIKGAGPLEGYLKRLVEKLNISKHVRFVGLVPYDEVARYLCASDIYVSTCFVDSTSVSLLEAMACGVPPVVTDIPGNREWIKDGEDGLLFPPKNSSALAEKIMQLTENQSLRNRFGKRCFQIIKRRATWEKCVSKMEAIYKSLL